MQFWPPVDEHMCSKHVEAWNKLIVKQKFFASNWLITEIKKTLHVSDSSSAHHQQFFTVHTATVYVIQLASRIMAALQFRPDPARKLSAHIPLLCVQWNTPDERQRNCPKHVQIYLKNKFEKLVHLVGFIIRIYHDARSHGRQTELLQNLFLCLAFTKSFSWLLCSTVVSQHHAPYDSIFTLQILPDDVKPSLHSH